MNVDECVLNFILFMSSLVVTMEIHYYSVFGRSFNHSWSPWSLLFIYGPHRLFPIFVFTLRPIFFVPFWPISAYSKFGHEHIAQNLLSPCVDLSNSYSHVHVEFEPKY